MRAKKSLGQNFLIDNNIINKIAIEVDAKEDDLIIEIGPGRGALTKELLKKGSLILAYEIDKDLDEFLSKIACDNFKIIYKDFLASDLTNDLKDLKYNNLFIVGNLPYYITTPIIEHVIEEKIRFQKFTVMVQREVANRFMARPKTKEYGYITVVLEFYFNINKVIDVSKYSFNPVPKVESAVISFTKKEIDESVDKEKYFKFLKQAFGQKRKTLRNNLKGYDFDKIKFVLEKNGLSDSVRAEEIDGETFIEIFKCLSND